MVRSKNQQTIKSPVSCYGIGIHSGRRTQMTLKPAPTNTGIIFIRTDIKDVNNVIPASYQYVHNVTLCTSIKNDTHIGVSTIEHLMAAIWGVGVDNLIIEIDGPEVPIMDGSSKAFVFMLAYSGLKMQNAKKRFIKIIKDIHVTHNDSEIFVTASDNFTAEVAINFDNRVIGSQSHKLVDEADFCREIADSRTFGFVHELDYFKSQGLAQGASLDNGIGIDRDTILNHEGLRYDNEFARHKLLDLLGDVFCAGAPIIGDIKASKTGHALNNKFLHNLFSNPNLYEFTCML